MVFVESGFKAQAALVTFLAAAYELIGGGNQS